MTSDFHLEPFPLFIDSAPPNSANYFSSPMAMAAIQLLATSTSSSSHDISSSIRMPRIPMPTKLSNYLRLRYYQYEVTFGLYVMTPTEKLIFNMMILIVFSALFSGLYWGFQPFVVNAICKFVYYMTGSLSTAPDMCS